MVEGWTKTQLKDVASTITSGSRGWGGYYADSGAAFIRMTNLPRDGICLKLNDLKHVRLPDGSDEGKRTRLQDGDILISITAELGKIGYVELGDLGEAYINQHVALVRIQNEEICNQFLAYLLSHPAQRNKLQRLNDSGAKAGLNLQTIGKFPVSLPPLPEQRKIAQVLSTWDAAIRLSESLIAKKQRHKKALMQRLLTGTLRFPGFAGQEWQEVKLGEIVEINRKNIDEKTAPDFQFYYIDLASVKSGKIAFPSSKIRFADAPSRARRYATENSIVMATVRPNLKGFAYIDFKSDSYIFSTGFAILEPKAETCAKFVYNILYSHSVESQISAMLIGSNYPAISAGDVASLKVPYPSLEEQRAIAAVLEAADQEIHLLQAKLAALCGQKRGLMQQLLTGKVRVKVEDTTPTIQPQQEQHYG